MRPKAESQRLVGRPIQSCQSSDLLEMQSGAFGVSQLSRQKHDQRGCGALPKTCHHTAINKASIVEREGEEAARKELNKSVRRWRKEDG